MTQVRELDVGTRFGWRDSVWSVRTRGMTYVEAQDEQFSTFKMFQERPAHGDPSWFTEIRLIGEPEPGNKPWTPRELIESLSKWKSDEPIETHIQQVGLGEHVAIISQGTNSINLSDKD